MTKAMCPEPDMDNTMQKFHQDTIFELKKVQHNQRKLDDQEMVFHQTSVQVKSLASEKSATRILTENTTNEDADGESTLDYDDNAFLAWN